MSDKYNPIVSDVTKKTFLEYLEYVDIPEIDYFAIGIQANKYGRSLSLMSRPEWQKLFVENNYAEFDPLRSAAFYSKRNFIPFKEIDFINSTGKEIMRQRCLLEIRDGVILMERAAKFNYMITLGTGFTKFDALDFLRHYYRKLHRLKEDFTKIIEKDAKAFLSKLNINL